MLFGQRKSKNKYEGYIGFYKLEEFWDSLTLEEQEYLKNIELRLDNDPRILIIGKLQTQGTPLGFLWSKMQYTVEDGRNNLTEKIIAEVESKDVYKRYIIDLHFYYTMIIKYHYKNRIYDLYAIEKCVHYCLKDIALFPKYKKQFIKEWGNFDVCCPSFQRLAIIYEKQGKYEDAIKICKFAIANDLKDTTKGGFNGRLKKNRKETKQENAIVLFILSH